ncbi:tRNA lysidine(34) synthetase TilS [Quadrisphaera sp. GCM10027208]|uniref:tRNA lysidine(34) synthetase TilS n=1 Tax=Quadrisphaera sp. GCM10027208 TaxID=3273423 RepID=UPI00361650B9
MSGPDPAVAAVRAAVRREVADLPAGRLVVVGCSGGADSFALAAATAFTAPRAGLVARAVVVDHGLQPGSAEVAARAAATCRSLGLAADVVRVRVSPDGEGTEAAARAARLAALEEQAPGGVVLLGHTRDDQAEQVLLGLARGAGTRSLAGMPRRRGPFRRPLLGLPRATTEQACRALGLHWWADPANADPAYTRSRVRHRVLPVLEAELGPGVAEALARSAEALRADADALDDLAARAAADVRTDDGDLDAALLAALPAAVRTRVLRTWLLDLGAPAGSLTREHVLAVDALVTGWHGQGPLHLPGRVVVRRVCGRLTPG